MERLHAARLAIWAFDFNKAKDAVGECMSLLKPYSSTIYEAVRSFSSLEDRMEPGTRVKNRLLLGEALRKSHVNSAYFVGESLLAIARRYESYLQEALEYKDLFHHCEVHESGYTYVIFPVGTAKYELRAYRGANMSFKNVGGLLDVMGTSLAQDRLEPRIMLLEKLTDEDVGAPYGVEVRASVARNVTVDLLALDDGTLSAEILADNVGAGTRIAQSILNAFRSAEEAGFLSTHG